MVGGQWLAGLIMVVCSRFCLRPGALEATMVVLTCVCVVEARALVELVRFPVYDLRLVVV